MNKSKEEICLDYVLNNFDNAEFYCCEKSVIKNILISAKRNKELTNFPDLMLPNGFIEHFQITSSKTTRKGATHEKEIAQYQKENEQVIKNSVTDDDLIVFRSFTTQYPKHSREYLIESLKNEWNNHIDHFNKYDGLKTISVFMIQYNDRCLQICESIPKEDVYIISKERPQQCFDFYSLVRDFEALDFVGQYSDKINYVIYVTNGHIEIINLKTIPSIKKQIPYGFSAVYTPVIRMDSYMYLNNGEDNE